MPINKSVVPVSKLIVGYRDLFPGNPIVDRLSLLHGVSKLDVVVELAGLNFRMKGSKAKFIDVDFETQNRELLYFCGGNKELYLSYAQRIDAFTKGKQSYIFTRQGCLFALEELLQSDLPVIDGFQMSQRLSSWERILNYILAVNSEITKFEENQPDEPIDFETLNPKLLPISELLLFSDPFYNVYRGFKFMEFLNIHEETNEYFKEYISERFEVSFDEFIFEVYRMWMANKQPNGSFNFYYQIPEDEPKKNIFEELSKKHHNEELYKLLNIRKNPFFQAKDNVFILTDFSNLLDITYGQLINDFFFDKIKGRKKRNGSAFTMQDYKGIFGRFFEDYVRHLMAYSFEYSRSIVMKMFEELEIQPAIGSRIECGDIYIRSEKRIVFGEVKSTSIYDAEKYGGNVDILYKNDRNKFFKDFGVDQLAKNILNIRPNISILDPGLAEKKKLRIWPIIIFNEKSFQTPLMAQIFNNRFKELLPKHPDKNIHVYPLTLIHVSDLENIESTIHKKPGMFWDILIGNFRNGVKFIPPFYHTINRFDIRAGYQRVKQNVIGLFKKYGKDAL